MTRRKKKKTKQRQPAKKPHHKSGQQKSNTSNPALPGSHHPASYPDDVLKLQQVIGNRSISKIIHSTNNQRMPSTSGIQLDIEGLFDTGNSPLADYPHLRTALSPDNFARLEDAAARRLAIARGEKYESPPGLSRITVSVSRMLPATIEYVPRAELIESFYHQLATVDGPSPNLDTYIHLMAKSETLRQYLENKLHFPVQIVLDDPEGATDDPTQLRFFVGGTEVETIDGKLPVSALDTISVTTFAQLAAENAAAARGLANIKLLEEKVAFAKTEIPPLADQIAGEPEKFAYNDVKILRNTVNELVGRIEQSQANLHPFNTDFADKLAEISAGAEDIKATTSNAFNIARNFFGTHQPEYTSGETYDMAEEEYWRKSELSFSGAYNFGNLAATKVFHFLGSALTAGNLDLQAANASIYRKGMISWEAYKENEWWNLGRSAIVAVVGGLSAGWAGRAAAGLFSLEAGSAASTFVTGSAGGGAFGLGGALGSDAYAKIVAELTSDPDIAAYHEATIGGPQVWIEGLAYGAMAGGFFSWLASIFSRRGPGVNPGDLGKLEESAVGETGKAAEGGEFAGVGVAKSGKPVVFIEGQPFEPTSYGRVYHGTEMPPEVVLREGLPKKGGNWDLVNHVMEGPDSALRGATTEVFTPDKSAGAGLWGEWVYEIRGMPSWDVNALMEGRIKTPGGFRGNPMRGELEHAIPAEVPAESIVRVAHITEVAGRIKVEWMLPVEALAKRSP